MSAKSRGLNARGFFLAGFRNTVRFGRLGSTHSHKTESLDKMRGPKIKLLSIALLLRLHPYRIRRWLFYVCFWHALGNRSVTHR